MTLTQHLLTLGALWLGWVVAGVVYDPIAAPHLKNGAPNGHARFLVMWAYCSTLRGWLALARFGKEPGDGRKSTGELLAAIFVMSSRKYIRRAIRVMAVRR